MGYVACGTDVLFKERRKRKKTLVRSLSLFLVLLVIVRGAQFTTSISAARTLRYCIFIWKMEWIDLIPRFLSTGP